MVRRITLIAVMLGVFVLLPGAVLVLHDPPVTAHAHASATPPDPGIAAATRDMRQQGYTQVSCLKHHDADGIVCYATDSNGKSVIAVYLPAHTDHV
jgi:hypothetical protein